MSIKIKKETSVTTYFTPPPLPSLLIISLFCLCVCVGVWVCVRACVFFIYADDVSQSKESDANAAAGGC